MKKRVAIITDNPERARASNHLHDLLAGLQAQPLPPGRVYSALVRHDSWCALLANRGPCNCNPDLEIAEVR
jgi:hypothetical protein